MKLHGYGILKIILSGILTACLFASGCSFPFEQNDEYISIPVNTPLAPAPVETEITANQTVSSDYIDTDALFETVRNTIAGNHSEDNSYCSYIFNRYYIAKACENNNAKATVFTDVYNAIATFQTEYVLPQGIAMSEDDMRLTMFALFEDCPELFHVSPSYTYYTRSDSVVRLEFEYNMTPEQYLAALQKTYAKLDEWAMGYTGTYDYELELYMYDRLLEACTYSDTAEYCRTPYGAVVLGNALCEGYSQAFMMAMQYNGIFCIQVGGQAENPETGKSEPHAWNIVNVQGDYYQVDPTWDDYDPENASSSLYAYFNVTDAQMYAHRTLEDNYSMIQPPECTAQQCSYYTLWGNEVGENTDIHDFLFTALEAHAQSLTEQGGVMLLKIKFRDMNTYKSFTDNLYSWLEEWNKTAETPLRITGFSWRTIESMGVLWAEMYSSSTIDPNITDDENMNEDMYSTTVPDIITEPDEPTETQISDSTDAFYNSAYIIPLP